MRKKFVWLDGKWVDREQFRPPAPSHYVISDVMDQIQSMADGKHYDSKSEYRKGLRAAGMAEVGTERNWIDKPDPHAGLRDEVERSWYEKTGY